MRLNLNPRSQVRAILGLTITASFFMPVLFCTPVQAAPASYVMAGNGSGSVDGVGFSNADFVYTASADTNDIVLLPDGILKVINSNMHVSISRLGEYDFLDVTQTVAKPGGIPGVGFGNNTRDLGIFFLQSPLFNDIDLQSSIGPLEDAFATYFGGGIASSTTAGEFLMFNLNSVSFEARVVPEPTTSLLLAASLTIAVLWRRR